MIWKSMLLHWPNFANYDVMFGSIGAVIVLLAYIHLSIAVLLFGAEVDAVIELRARSHADPQVAS